MKISLADSSADWDPEPPCKSWTGVSATLHPALANEGDLHSEGSSLVSAARLVAALLAQGITSGCQGKSKSMKKGKRKNNSFKRQVGKRRKKEVK